MADLKALFDESGLAAIVPYAFNMTGAGYDFLCNKLRSGERIWCVYSEQNAVPFISLDNATHYVYSSTFTTNEQAEQFVEKLAIDDFKTVAMEIDLGESIAGLWEFFRDMGISHIRLDEAIWVDISNLAPKANYDGFLTPKYPIRNAKLNAALYYMLEYIDANISFDASVAHFWSVFQTSYFYLPVRPRTALKKGEALKDDNMDYHYAPSSDNAQSVLVFTDQHFLESYAQQHNLSPEEYTAAFTPDFENLKKFMEENPDLSITLNLYHGSLILSLDFFDKLETIALNQAAVDAGNQH